jgi:hypothetical protein
MNKQRVFWMATPALGLAVLLGGSGPARALDIQMYAITDWISECSAGDRSGWDAQVRSWYDAAALFGHNRQLSFVNGNFNRNLLCDPDTGLAGCDDAAWGDSGDAVMLGLHGRDSGNHWAGALRRNGGAAVNDCYIDAPESGSGELFFGDVDTEFLHLSSCNSLDDDNLPNAWRMLQDPVDSPKNGRRMHQVNGFHGMMGIGPGYYPDYTDFGILASVEPVKDAWQDTQYHPEMSNQKCPISYAVGNGKNDCFNRIQTESYANVGADPTAITYYCYYYFEGCDPAAEDTFTPPN